MLQRSQKQTVLGSEPIIDGRSGKVQRPLEVADAGAGVAMAPKEAHGAFQQRGVFLYARARHVPPLFYIDCYNMVSDQRPMQANIRGVRMSQLGQWR